ncbi:MAG TPA: sulfate adenylyltransferase subunit CysN [Steroidobacteraceae bacterium]|jgi:bifunctional enzyme CysN/CysC|nr:sulfate adenylyltransferase subunit CysN [Steroidobacteraceae bacterium]
MSAEPEPLPAQLNAWLAAQADKDLLRFITCGSVDDGKSTLIGRLLYESRVLFEDQLLALERDSRRLGTQGEELDFALLVDGLAAEREQGITIDVAYRFFATEHRKYIVADTPGHEQYTRNMVTGASTAELAVILIDARKGVLTQTRRHSYLVSLLGIRRVVLAINKMDLVDYAEPVFRRIEREYREFAARIGLTEITAIPVSALVGDNVIEPGTRMPWYRGPTLLSHLDTVPPVQQPDKQPFRMPVQWVNRPNQEFRGYAGLIVGGGVRVGDPLVVLPSGLKSRVARIIGPDGDLPQAAAGQSVTLALEDQIDVSRGDLFAPASAPAQVSDLFEATVVWMSEEPMLPGRPYLLKCGTRTVTATVAPLKHKINVNTLEKLSARQLELNEIGLVHLNLDRPLAFDPYEDNRDTGGFILIDRISNGTVGAGLLHAALQRAHDLHWQTLDIDQASRSAQKQQRACVLWFTGLSGAGKSTIANLVEKRLFGAGRHTYLLDGDNVRHGLCRDLGFSDADRVENIRRVGEVARLMTDAGLIVLVSFISPFRAERRLARSLLASGEFFEIYIDTPLEEAEKRDTKGLYRKARAGEIHNFTGIDSPYEPPENPEVHIDTRTTSAEQAAEQIIAYLRKLGVIDRDWVFIP